MRKSKVFQQELLLGLLSASPVGAALTYASAPANAGAVRSLPCVMPDEAVAELTNLTELSEASICSVLHKRLLAGDIYTGVSAMLLAVNPCEWLPGLYSDAAIDRYLASEANPPPHVFRTCLLYTSPSPRDS